MISFSPRRIFRAHSKGILNISFNKEQRLLMSAGFDHTIYVWTPYMDKPVMTIDGHNASLVKVMAIPKT